MLSRYLNPVYGKYQRRKRFETKTLFLFLRRLLSDNQPLEIFKTAAVQMFRKTNMPEKLMQDKVIAMWALVHGLAAITAMPNVESNGNWKLRIL